MYNLPELLNKGTLTGSRAFKVATEESDWDIVINESEYNLVLTDISNLDIDYNEHQVIPGNILPEAPDRSENPYDPTIWGPILCITKYEDDNNNYINLFVYPDDIYEDARNLFLKVNFFIHKHRNIHDRDNRIEAFIDLVETLAPNYWLAEVD